MCPFPFGIEDRIWDVIVLIPEYCISINFPKYFKAMKVHFSVRGKPLLCKRSNDKRALPVFKNKLSNETYILRKRNTYPKV